MRHFVILLVAMAISGCNFSNVAMEKSQFGNLEINIVNKDQIENFEEVEIFIDKVPMGNISKTRPILYLTRKMHTVEARLPGYKKFHKEIMILGEPNHQVLNIRLEKL